MPSQSQMAPKDLSDLLEEAYIIADSNKLYGVRPKVFKNHEEGFKDSEKNFATYVHYSLSPGRYSQWILTVEAALRRHSMQDAKFRVKINEYDPSRESNLPAQKFIRAIQELEKITYDEKYRASYAGSPQLSPVSFRNNTLTQGGASHSFNAEYAEFISFLWQYREVQNSAGMTTKTSEPQTYSMIESRTGIKRSRYANIAKALHKLSRDKNIHIQLKYPRNSNGAHLVVQQD